MRVVISEQADRDLRGVARHIAQESRARAVSYTRELRGRCRALATMPEGWSLMEGFEGFGFRKRVHGSYLIVFRVTAREVEVLNVIHGARDYAVVLA